MNKKYLLTMPKLVRGVGSMLVVLMAFYIPMRFLDETKIYWEMTDHFYPHGQVQSTHGIKKQTTTGYLLHERAGIPSIYLDFKEL